MALMVAAICWLSLAQHSEAQFGLRETQRDNGDGTWTITTVISNNSTNDKTVAWWTWPATAPNPGHDTSKIGTNIWYPPSTPPHPIEPKFPDTFAPGTNLAAGASVTNRITVTNKPYGSYVRIFTKNDDGLFGGDLQETLARHDTNMAVSALLPRSNADAQLAIIFLSIPYPEDLAKLTGNQPAQFFIKSVACPPGWSPVFLAPAIDERFPLMPGQKSFTGTLVVRRGSAMAEGEVAIVGVTWGAESGAVNNYEHTIRSVLVQDTTPPTVTLQAQISPQGTFVTIRVRDPGGVHHPPRLVATRTVGQVTTREVCVIPHARDIQQDPLQEIGTTEAEFKATIRSPANQEMLSLQAIAVDQFGNSASSPTEVFVGAGIQGIELIGGSVVVTFAGTLMEADEVTGPFTPVAGATSPYSCVPTGKKKFFKAE